MGFSPTLNAILFHPGIADDRDLQKIAEWLQELQHELQSPTPKSGAWVLGQLGRLEVRHPAETSSPNPCLQKHQGRYNLAVWELLHSHNLLDESRETVAAELVELSRGGFGRLFLSEPEAQGYLAFLSAIPDPQWVDCI